MISKKYLGSLMLLLTLSCCNKKENPYQIIANPNDDEYFVRLNDSTEDVYNFHSNRKLRYYVTSINRKSDGQAFFFYQNGGIKVITKLRKGKRNGISYRFYPSGNTRQVKHYVNDSLRGYFVQYYDEFGLKKAEYMAGYNSLDGFVYKRSYDSASQIITEVIDHRHIELEEHPYLNADQLKMPWEY